MELNTEDHTIQNEKHKIYNPPVPMSREISGLAVFIIVFLIIIPYFLLKLDYSSIMLYYFSNVDLIASVLNHWDNFFDNLYYFNPISDYTFLSSTLINFISLLGVSAIVGITVLKYKSIFYGLASATTVLLITYLMASTVINYAMVNIDGRLNKYFNRDISNNLAVVSGVILSLMIVVIEVALSKKYIGDIASGYEKIYRSVIQLID